MTVPSSDQIGFGGDVGIRPVHQMTPEALLTLLRAHQDGVYTVCLHVLRNPHDAEDAAQEALLKIASGAKDLREPRAFKSWLYRLVFRTAVDHARRRATRRRIEEGSVPMSPAPLSDEQRDAIHEAMAALPDDDRLMLVEHYFEKAPLVELARREGVSDVTMGKRLEKAREKLKRGLAGAGILLGSSQVTDALESVSPATAPAGLIGTAIASKAALVAAGGAALSGKSSIAAGLLVILAFIVLIGVGLQYITLGKTAANEREAYPNQPERAPASPPSDDPVRPATSIPSQRGNIPACRALLARAAIKIRSNDVHFLAWEIHKVQAGKMPLIEGLLREFTDSAGPDLIPIARNLIAETESDAIRFLITVALGRSREPGSIELLKSLAGDGASVPIAASAVYSIGLHRTPESLAFLQSTWEKLKESGGPLGQQLLLAVGLQGAEVIPWIQAEIRNGKLDKLLTHQGAPWSFSFTKGDCFAFIRGADAFHALRGVFETETDPEVRRGAVRGMASTIPEGQADYFASIATNTSDFELKRSAILALLESDSSFRSSAAERIIKDTPFPSGNQQLDVTLVRLAGVATRETSEALFERCLTLVSTSKIPGIHHVLASVIGAVQTASEAETRIKALKENSGLSEEQKRAVMTMGLQGASPEAAGPFIGPVLELIQSLDPDSDHFHNGVKGLMISGVDEKTLSKALKEADDSHPGPLSQFRLMQVLISWARNPANQSRVPLIPETYLSSKAAQRNDADTVISVAYCLGASGSDGFSSLRGRIAEWIGRDMKWTSNMPEHTLLTFVAPMVIGDYYSRFGSADDMTYLRGLPESFPYPPAWDARIRSMVKKLLGDETRRAIDAIRLRN